MTVPELIARVLHMLQAQFYCDLPRSAFHRDEKYLVAAIGTYGHECRQRGWEFDCEFMYQEFCGLVQSFMRSGAEPRWMPLYFQTAIRRHIGERAEELNARGKSTRSVPATVRIIVSGLKVVTAVRQASATDLMASVYRDVRKLRSANGAARRMKTAAERRQQNLL